MGGKRSLFSSNLVANNRLTALSSTNSTRKELRGSRGVLQRIPGHQRNSPILLFCHEYAGNRLAQFGTAG